MKIVAAVCRCLLGLLFVVFGLNGFLHFIPLAPATGLELELLTAMLKTHYLMVPFALQVVGGALLLANRYVPLGLVLLGPVIVNILLFHGLTSPEGLPPGIGAAVLWLVVFVRHRAAFADLFAPRSPGHQEATDSLARL